MTTVNPTGAATVVADALESGATGATVSIVTLQAPTTGYVVALAGLEQRTWHHSASASYLAIATYAKRNQARLAWQGHSLGAWLTDNGQLVLDVVEVVVDRAYAVDLGIARDQDAIYCLDTGETITLTEES